MTRLRAFATSGILDKGIDITEKARAIRTFVLPPARTLRPIREEDTSESEGEEDLEDLLPDAAELRLSNSPAYSPTGFARSPSPRPPSPAAARAAASVTNPQQLQPPSGPALQAAASAPFKPPRKAPAKPPAVPKATGKRPAPEPRINLEESSDGSGDSSDDDEDDRPNEPPPRRQKQTTPPPKPSVPRPPQPSPPRKQPPPPSRKRPAGPTTTEDEFPNVAAITPPGLTYLEALRIFFAEKRVRDAAECDPVPSHVPESDLRRTLARYDRVFDILDSNIGDAYRTSDYAPTSISELEDMAEEAQHLACRLLSGARFARLDGGAPPSRRTSLPPPEISAPGGRLPFETLNRKPSEGLSGSKQAGAIAPAVAERLHARTDAIGGAYDRVVTADPAASAGDVIGECPSDIREDLRRAVMSNALVDGPGESRSDRTSLPAPAHALRRTSVREVETALRAVTNADQTGEAMVDPDEAASLAAACVEGTATLEMFAKIGRKSLGSSAAPANTVLALVEAWSFALPALTALMRSANLEAENFSALTEITATVNAPPGLARISPTQTSEWVERILRDWKQCARDFRLHDKPVPSLRACIEKQRANYQFKSLKAALQEDQTRTGPRQERERGRDRGDKSSRTKAPANIAPGTKGAPTGAPPPKPRANPKPAPTASQAAVRGDGAWPERRAASAVTLSNGKFAELKAAAIIKYPDLCIFNLLSKCNRQGCKHKHERPSDFTAFLGEHKVNLDGQLPVSGGCLEFSVLRLESSRDDIF